MLHHYYWLSCTEKQKRSDQVDWLCHHESRYSRCMLGMDLYAFGLWKLSTCLYNKYLYFFFLLVKEFNLARRLWIYSIMPQWVGLIDAVFSTLLLHTTPHPYHLSSAALQQVWLSSQTIRTVHITTHDRHKLSRAHRLTAYSYVPAVLPGWDIRKSCGPAQGFAQLLYNGSPLQCIYLFYFC